MHNLRIIFISSVIPARRRCLWLLERGQQAGRRAGGGFMDDEQCFAVSHKVITEIDWHRLAPTGIDKASSDPPPNSCLHPNNHCTTQHHIHSFHLPFTLWLAQRTLLTLISLHQR